MKLNFVALAVVIGTFAVALACVVVDHSLAGTVVGLLGTVAGALSPAMIQRLAANADKIPEGP